MLNRAEYATGMGQRSNDASLKDAQIMLKREECATGMGQRGNDAASKNAQIMLRREEFANDTRHKAKTKWCSKRMMCTILINMIHSPVFSP